MHFGKLAIGAIVGGVLVKLLEKPIEKLVSTLKGGGGAAPAETKSVDGRDSGPDATGTEPKA